MSELTDLIDKAVNDLQLYKHPDVTGVQRRLDELLKAADLGTIARDELTDLDVYGGNLHIHTDWSALGCVNSSDFTIPLTILQDDDPIKAATVWGLERKIAEEESYVQQLQASLSAATERLSALKQKLLNATMTDRLASGRPEVPWGG